MRAATPAPSTAALLAPELVLIFTRFPHPTETFLQREVLAFRQRGVRMRLVSMWGGADRFAGLPVERFPFGRLGALLWRLPWEVARSRGAFLRVVLRHAFRRLPPGTVNFWENLLGLGYGVVEAGRVRREKPRHVHAVWASAPAAAAWTLGQLAGVPFSFGAHAYDLYEHGGDWLLGEKAAAARFVRTSTAMAAATLRARGIAAEKILLVRRGLDVLPPCKPLRRSRTPLRLVCIARLVEKKGLERQLALYAAARDAGVSIEARIYGDGPLRARLARQIRTWHLDHVVELMGHRPPAEILAALAWADVLVHTGVIARSGDRDGLPNAIPEAMAAGTIVVTSPVAATLEAIVPEQTGLVAEVGDTGAWIAAWRRLAANIALCERLQTGARRWVETNFDVHRNCAVLLARLREES